MKSFVYYVVVTAAILGLSVEGRAQLIITKDDLDANIINTTRTTYGFGDTLTVDLGTASGSAQSVDYSNLPKGLPSNRDTTIINFVPASGQWKSELYAGA